MSEVKRLYIQIFVLIKSVYAAGMIMMMMVVVVMMMMMMMMMIMMMTMTIIMMAITWLETSWWEQSQRLPFISLRFRTGQKGYPRLGGGMELAAMQTKWTGGGKGSC